MSACAVTPADSTPLAPFHLRAGLVEQAARQSRGAVRIEAVGAIEVDVRVAVAAEPELVGAEGEPRVGVLGLQLRRVEVARERPGRVPRRRLRERPRPQRLDRQRIEIASLARGGSCGARVASRDGRVRVLDSPLRDPRRRDRVEDGQRDDSRTERRAADGSAPRPAGGPRTAARRPLRSTGAEAATKSQSMSASACSR